MYLNGDKQRETLQGVVIGLMRELGQLAPHPDQKDPTTPYFLSYSDYFKQPADYDAMLGSMMLESFLGTAFLQAASQSHASHATWIGGFSAMSHLVDECDELYKDRYHGPDRGEGKGTFALMSRKAIANDFNKKSAHDTALAAFELDLPRRRQIESALSATLQKMKTLDAQPELALAA